MSFTVTWPAARSSDPTTVTNRVPRADAGNVFMLRVRGESMIDAGIFDGDYVVVRQQPEAEKGEIVVAGIPGEEATVKTFTRKGNKVVLVPANERFSPMEFDPADVSVFGKVVTVLRRL